MDGPGHEDIWSPNFPLEEKLYRVHYEVDRDNPHITVDYEACKNCGQRVCTFICPAKVYVAEGDEPSRILVRHENCLECGTCRFACPRGAIKWNHPNGGMGVRYRFG